MPSVNSFPSGSVPNKSKQIHTALLFLRSFW